MTIVRKSIKSIKLFKRHAVRDRESVSIRSVLKLEITIINAWTIETELSVRKSACENEENL